jgi:hypothetical protein
VKIIPILQAVIWLEIKNKMVYRLGRAIAQIVPFRYIQKKPQEIFTNKILMIIGIVAIVKIAVFLLWPL